MVPVFWIENYGIQFRYRFPNFLWESVLAPVDSVTVPVTGENITIFRPTINIYKKTSGQSVHKEYNVMAAIYIYTWCVQIVIINPYEILFLFAPRITRVTLLKTNVHVRLKRFRLLFFFNRIACIEFLSHPLSINTNRPPGARLPGFPFSLVFNRAVISQKLFVG